MENNYYDVIEKINFHKERIFKNFIEKGIYLNIDEINNKLNNIDCYLSIFSHNNVVTGEKFNTDEYNEAIKLIFKDLSILYNIVFNVLKEEYKKQLLFIDSHIKELNSIVSTYKKRADFENSSTSLGKTLLFKSDNFLIKNNNSTSLIELGNISTNKGTTLMCMANINNIEEDNLMFILKNKNNILTVSPYNYLGDLLTIPGEKILNKYTLTLQENQKIEGPLLLNIDTDININNNYNILAAKNNIFINNENTSTTLIPIPYHLNQYVFSEKTYISFYIVGGNTANISFNKKPLSANFSIDNKKIENLKYIHHLFMECDAGFSFSIEIDTGDIYAIKEDGIVDGNNLYYTGMNEVKDFTIFEELTGEEVEYTTYLEIKNNNTDDFDIDTIIIKEVK